MYRHCNFDTRIKLFVFVVVDNYDISVDVCMLPWLHVPGVYCISADDVSESNFIVEKVCNI